MYKAIKENLDIRHALNGLEAKIGGFVNGKWTDYKIDGKCEQTVYEFNGCKYFLI